MIVHDSKDGQMAIGEVADMDTFRIEGTDKVMRGIDAPPGFWECDNVKERDHRIKQNMRGILQLFNIKVYIYPDKVGIRGSIPSQVISMMAQKEPETENALIIRSSSLAGKRVNFLRGLARTARQTPS